MNELKGKIKMHVGRWNWNSESNIESYQLLICPISDVDYINHGQVEIELTIPMLTEAEQRKQVLDKLYEKKKKILADNTRNLEAVEDEIQKVLALTFEGDDDE